MAVVERITRTVYNPCRGLAVKHQVVFGSKDQAQKRRGELYVHNYTSSRYSDVSKLSSMSLETSDFVFLEKLNYEKGVENEKIFMSYPHIFKMKRALRNVLKWFYGDEYEDMYLYNGNVLTFNSDFGNEKEEVYNLVGNKSVHIIPDVIEIEGVQYEGVTMFLNSLDVSVQMTIDQVESLQDFFDSFNLYQSSLQLINYVTSVNPENTEGTGFAARQGKATNSKLPLKKKTKSKKTSKEDSE
jgi:hypothetical protein